MSDRCTPTRAIRNSTISSVTEIDLKDPVAPAARPAAIGALGASVSPVDIEAWHLCKRFGKTLIFSDVGLRLARGETVALVGANGTGKSALLRSLIGLLPVSAGTVRLLGDDLTTAKAGQADFALRRADRLSGGQSQRVAIARAIVGKPEILIADEPCASLDPAAGEEVMALFFRLARQDGVTVVFTSHNIDHALRYGDRVLGLAGGGLRLDATAASLSPSDLRGLYD